MDKKERQKQYRKEHPKERKEEQERYRKKHHKEILEKQRKKYLKYNLEKYNLSHNDWLKIWENQDGKCAICEEPFAQPSNACIDHNHETGEIRGLLCRTCNLGIGCFNDNPKLIGKIIEYLR